MTLMVVLSKLIPIGIALPLAVIIPVLVLVVVQDYVMNDLGKSLFRNKDDAIVITQTYKP